MVERGGSYGDDCSGRGDDCNSHGDGCTSPLRKYFEQNLRLPSGIKSRVLCHILSDVYRLEDWKDEAVGPRRTTREYLQTRHLVLFFIPGGGGLTPGRISPSQGASPNKKRVTEYQLVMGFTAWEYYFRDRPNVPSRAYIQYVDTTGMFRPRRLQGSLTRAALSVYLRYCREVLQVSGVHLFASAKPSLLFNESDQLARKRILDGGRLVNWWLALIDSTFSSIIEVPSFVQHNYLPPRGFAFCAGEESMPIFAQMLRNNLATLNRFGHVHWSYGHPYGDDEDVSMIPLFEDDPKWRHYEAIIEYGEERPAKRQRRETDQMCINQFFNSMGIRMDIRQDPSAFLIIQFPENISGIPFNMSIMRKNEIAAFASKLLQTLTFRNDSEVVKSSMKLWSWLKLMATTPFEVICEKDPDADEEADRFRSLLIQLQARCDINNRIESSAIPMDCQVLIRRKIPKIWLA